MSHFTLYKWLHSPSINQDNPVMADVQLQFNIQLGESQHVSSSLHLWRASAPWITFRNFRQLTSVGQQQKVNTVNKSSHINSVSGGHLHLCAIMLLLYMAPGIYKSDPVSTKYYQYHKVKQWQELMRERPPCLIMTQMLLDASTTF